MSQRWKPFVLLCALFFLLAAGGLLAISSVMPNRSKDVLPVARSEAAAGRFDDAKIHYLNVLQRDPKNAAVTLELAAMLATWRDRTEDPEKKRALREEWLSALGNAASQAPQSPEPRRLLLADALAHEELGDALHWARQLLPLEPTHADARAVLADEALERRPVATAEARSHLEVLAKAQPDRARTAWLRARQAEVEGRDAELDAQLAALRTTPPATTDAADRLATLRSPSSTSGG